MRLPPIAERERDERERGYLLLQRDERGERGVREREMGEENGEREGDEMVRGREMRGRKRWGRRRVIEREVTIYFPLVMLCHHQPTPTQTCNYCHTIT